MRKTLCILLLIMFSLNVISQVDNEFWFACPDLSSDHNDKDIKLCFMTFDKASEISISQPANPDFTPVTKLLEANSTWEMNFSPNVSSSNYKSLFKYLETKTGNGNSVVKTGILIKATNKISAYYSSYTNNSEIYAMKGRNALGTDFIIPSQYNFATTWGGWPSVEIVAPHDGTEVSITPSNNCVGHAANVPFTITLNRGESYALRASSQDADKHLFNTRITSTKPVAVNYTDDSLDDGVDLIGDQLVPVNLAGNKYIAVKNEGAFEQIYIFPTQDNTTVMFDGVKFGSVLNVGDKNMSDLVNPVTMITSDKPIILFQLTSNGHEKGGAILPALECTGSSEIAYKPTSTNAYVTLVTKTIDIGNFQVNGNSFLLPQTVFKKVPSNPEWSYTVRNLGIDDLHPVLRITNSSGYFHMGVLDNPGVTCSYGYFSNFNTIPLNAETNAGFYLDGDQIRLSLNNTTDLTDITWSGPNDFISTDESPLIANATIADEGRYVVIANHVEGCLIEPDTLSVSVLQQSETKSFVVCMGNNIELTAEGYSPYIWTPAGLASEQTITVSPKTLTTYAVSNQKPGFNLIRNGDFNKGNAGFTSTYSYNAEELTSAGSYVVGSNPKDFNTAYGNIKDHSTGDASRSQLIANTVSGNHILWEQIITNLVPGNAYELSVWTATAGGGTAELQFEINGITAGDVFSPSTEGSWQKNSFVWSSDAIDASIQILTTANTVSGSSICLDDISFSPIFPVIDKFEVTVIDSLQPQIRGDGSICYGSAQMNVEGNYGSYLWNTGESSQSITITEPGDYWVKVTDGDCKGTGYFRVEPNTMTIDVSLNDSTPEICPDQTVYRMEYNIEQSELGSYNIFFGEKALASGFMDVSGAEPTGNAFELILPEGVQPDVYSAVIEVYEKNCGRTNLLSVCFMVKYGPQVLTQRWNDILGVTNSAFNGAYTFDAYQWYRNGEKLAGETKSYLYEPETFTGEDSYKAGLKREGDTTEVFTCDLIPELLSGLDIVVQTVAMASATIRIQNLDSKQGTASFWSTTGHKVSVQKTEGYEATIKVPDEKGIYILHIKNGDINRQFKVIVE